MRGGLGAEGVSMLDLFNYVCFVRGERIHGILSWVQDEIPFHLKSALIVSSGTALQVQRFLDSLMS